MANKNEKHERIEERMEEGLKKVMSSEGAPALIYLLKLTLKDKESLLEHMDIYNQSPENIGIKFTANMTLIKYIKNLIEYLNKFKTKKKITKKEK